MGEEDLENSVAIMEVEESGGLIAHSLRIVRERDNNIHYINGVNATLNSLYGILAQTSYNRDEIIEGLRQCLRD